MLEKSLHSVISQIKKMAKLVIFILPKKYISDLLEEKRECILNEVTLPIGIRPTQPFGFLVNAWGKS